MTMPLTRAALVFSLPLWAFAFAASPAPPADLNVGTLTAERVIVRPPCGNTVIDLTATQDGAWIACKHANGRTAFLSVSCSGAAVEVQSVGGARDAGVVSSIAAGAPMLWARDPRVKWPTVYAVPER